MKNLFSLLFMCFLSLVVLTTTAQDEKKGSKGGSKGKAKTEKPSDKADKKEKAADKKEKAADKKEKAADKKGKSDDAKEKAADKKEKAADKKEKATDKKEKATEKVDKKEKKAADKDNTIKPAPAPKPNTKDDGKEADAATKKKVAGPDKQIGKDEKGRSIFQGPRGGQYYINSNGNKTYLKADNKL